LSPVANVVFQPVLFTASFCNEAYFRDRSTDLWFSGDEEGNLSDEASEPWRFLWPEKEQSITSP
jgi:hypothetical protein